MHLLPGLSAIALLAAAVLCSDPAGASLRASAPAGVPAADSPGRRRSVITRAVPVAAIGFVLALAGASLLRSGLAQIYLDAASRDLVSHPGAAVTNANRALRLDGSNLNTYYVKAAALARFDDAAGSRAVLLQAARVQPSSFVTWTLLGDLEVRVGDLVQARRLYRRALSFDPNDSSLTALVADPASALAPPASR
jgi:tetratricopeptide (TPR) repeat protein